MKKIVLGIAVGVMAITLSACSLFQKQKATEEEDITAVTTTIKADNEEMRLNFNKIALGHAVNEFHGGSTLEQVKALYGEPAEHKTEPAGDVTIDVYTWIKAPTQVTVKFFEDSAIVRSITNFAFIREAVHTKKTYEQLTEDMSYSEVVAILGEPDVLSQAVSSQKEEIQALWQTGLKVGSPKGAHIQILFENNLLKTKSQNGLAK